MGWVSSFKASESQKKLAVLRPGSGTQLYSLTSATVLITLYFMVCANISLSLWSLMMRPQSQHVEQTNRSIFSSTLDVQVIYLKTSGIGPIQAGIHLSKCRHHITYMSKQPLCSTERISTCKMISILKQTSWKAPAFLYFL